jgi:hypothetical protein
MRDHKAPIRLGDTRPKQSFFGFLLVSKKDLREQQQATRERHAEEQQRIRDGYSPFWIL